MTIKLFIILPLLYDPFFGKDKTKHFGASYIMGQVLYEKTHSIKRSIAITAAIGISKEIYDLKVKKTKFSFKDLFWDIVGATSGVLIEDYF